VVGRKDELRREGIKIVAWGDENLTGDEPRT